MPTGLSIHIGLNEIDEKHYGGRFTLAGCLRDVEAMHRLAADAGFEASVIQGENATADAVVGAIRTAAKRLESGDMLLVTYSGHGGRVRDVNDDEGDGWDETWCLYDRELIDDELFDCWADFAPGVRILVISDSCYSGDIIRDDQRNPALRIPTEPSLWGTVPLPETRDVLAAVLGRTAVDAPDPARRLRSGRARKRALSKQVASSVDRRHRALYAGIQRQLGPRREVHADVVLISAAQDNEAAQDGDQNGAFTAALVKLWNRGAFEGDYCLLHAELYTQLRHIQHPALLMLRPPAFAKERPFSI